MSVAFRRESDEEHREPRFELPIPPGPNLVTARGLGLIEDRAEALTVALAEAEEGEAREMLARDLRYWRTRAATAQVAPPPPEGSVGFGTTVRIRLNGAERELTLVGDDEAEPATGMIAWTAPLARALMGAEEGELLPFGGRDDAIEVLAIGA